MSKHLKIFTLLALAIGVGGILPVAANAVLVDLSVANVAARNGTIGSAYFEWIDAQSTGTGVIDAFLRVQGNNTERGFNTDHRPLNGEHSNINPSNQWTQSLLVNEFGVVDLAGTPSIRVMLDVNQTGASPLISLDELRIYTADIPNISSFADLASMGNLVYDMGVGNAVKLDYSLNPGSGGGDMFAYLPASLFAGLGSKYFYLESKFGVMHATNDGFEEWARVDGAPGDDPDPTIPEPASMMLVGMGLAGAAALKRRRN